MRDEKDNPARWPTGDLPREFTELWEVTGAWRGGPDPQVDPALARLHARLAAEDGPAIRRLNPRRWWSIAAAVALLLAALVTLRLTSAGQPPHQLVATEASLKVVELPDGSRVQLNKNSSLRWVPNQFETEERLVELTGEAFFTISSDPERPFRVVAGRAEVRVVGTRFNVRAYPGETEAEVAVLSGRVSVASAGHQLELKADQCARLEPGTPPRLETMNVDNAIAWQTGELVFRDSPLNQVVRQVERFFGVEIAWESAQHTRQEPCTVSAIWKDPQLEQVLAALEKLTGLHPERLNAARYRLVGDCSQ